MNLQPIKSPLAYFWCRLQRWSWSGTDVPTAVFNSGYSARRTQLFCFHWCTWHVDELLLEVYFWPINCCWNRNVWMLAPAEEVPKLWLPGSCWGEKMGKIMLQTCPVSFSSKPLLPVSIRNRFLSCIWLYGSFLRSRINVRQVFGTNWEIKRGLETRLVWTVTKSTNKTQGVLCEIRWWPVSLLDKRNRVPCLFYKMGLMDSSPFLPLVCPCSLRSSLYYCFIFAPWSVIQNWCPDWLAAWWSRKMNGWMLRYVLRTIRLLNRGGFPSYWTETFGVFARRCPLFPSLHASAIQYLKPD